MKNYILKKMRVYIGSDHGGYAYKKRIARFLKQRGVRCEDLGNFVYDKDDDYPDYALKVAKKVAKLGGRGVLICRNGVGMCIAANKVRGIRAANVWDAQIAKSSRNDDDINILCLGQDYISFDKIKKIILSFLKTPMSPVKRYRRRVRKISNIEKGKP